MIGKVLSKPIEVYMATDEHLKLAMENSGITEWNTEFAFTTEMLGDDGFMWETIDDFMIDFNKGPGLQGHILVGNSDGAIVFGDEEYAEKMAAQMTNDWMTRNPDVARYQGSRTPWKVIPAKVYFQEE